MPGPAALVVPPDWGTSLVERYAWLTDVQVARDGTEERTALREVPRRTVRYRALRQGHDARQLDADVWGWRGTADLDVPVWTDSTRTTSDLAPAGDTVACDTADRDLRVGARVVLTDGSSWELVTLSAVAAAEVTFVAGVAGTWPAGTKLLPVRAGRLLGVGRSYPTAGLVEGEVSVEVTALGDTVTPAGSGSTYRDCPLDTRRPNRASPVAGELGRLVERVDSDTGVWVSHDQRQRPVAARTLEYVLHGRDEIRGMLAWLHYVQGRASGFWQPTWQADLELVATVAGGATDVTVRGLSYVDRYMRQGRIDLAFWHKPTRTMYARRLVAIGGGGDEETFTLDAALPVGGAPDDWCVSWLEYVRLDADEVEVAYTTAEVARVQLAVREIVVEEVIVMEEA